jgi:hypothetical protein
VQHRQLVVAEATAEFFVGPTIAEMRREVRPYNLTLPYKNDSGTGTERSTEWRTKPLVLI